MKHWLITLTNWYSNHHRKLPWRETNEPYKIWISEIIFQQTRINQGMEYYIKFMKIFPDIQTLANSSIEEVLKVWQGLGYYRRALHLYETAKIIVNEFNGNFPDSYNEIIQLKGIGSYTAAAIASICFDEKIPVVDGNVHRLFCRFYAKNFSRNSRMFYELVKKEALVAMKSYHAGLVNQSMMDYGAIVCKPLKPLCQDCVLNKECRAFAEQLVQYFPLKASKKKLQTQYFYFYFVHDKLFCYLKKRTCNGIWKGLYEFPMIEVKDNIQPKVSEVPFLRGLTINTIQSTKCIKHVLSHKIIYATLITLEVQKLEASKGLKKVLIKDLFMYPMSKLMEKFIAHIDKMLVS